MVISGKARDTILKGGILALIILGIFIRVKTYFHCESLYIDEANLARNIAERGFSELWSQLSYEQYAPPLFLTVVKGVCELFGYSEFTLRLVALLSGIACFFLIYLVSLHFFRHERLGKIWIALVLALYGFTYGSIIYSNVLKQYNSDLLIALTLTLCCLRIEYQKLFSPLGLLFWTLTGAIAIWACMPSIFILTAVAVYYLVRAHNHGEGARMFRFFIIPATIWTISFLIYFFSILKTDSESDYLQISHASYFIPYDLWKIESWHSLWKLLRSNIANYVGSTAITIIGTLLFIGAGVWHIIRRKMTAGLLLLLPIILALTASLFRYYSLIPRLNFFMIVFFFIILAIGLKAAWDAERKWLKAIVLFLSAITISNLNGWRFIKPNNYPVIEQTREVMDLIADSIRASDAVFVHNEAAPAVIFYVKHHRQKQQYAPLENFRTLRWDEHIAEESNRYLLANPDSRLWILWGHSTNEVINQKAEQLIESGLHPLHEVRKWRARALCLKLHGESQHSKMK